MTITEKFTANISYKYNSDKITVTIWKGNFGGCVHCSELSSENISDFGCFLNAGKSYKKLTILLDFPDPKDRCKYPLSIKIYDEDSNLVKYYQELKNIKKFCNDYHLLEEEKIMFDKCECYREFEVTMEIGDPDILTIVKKGGLRHRDPRACEFKGNEAWEAWKDITKKDTFCSSNIARIFVSFRPNENFAPYKVTIIDEDGLVLKEIDDAGSILDFCKRYNLIEAPSFVLDKSCSNAMDQSGLEGFDEAASKFTKTGFDKITHPSHYCEGRRYEPKDVIADWKLDFFLGNTLKYISRAGRKDSETFIEDLEKARQYLDWEISLRKGDFWHGKK